MLCVFVTAALNPLPPLPSARQLLWHERPIYAFVHFGPNTFTGAEWGEGNEDPRLFDPKRLDCGQWVRTFKEAGLGMVILTAKHHDGFCLWPSKFSTHTVAQSPWRGGKGDVLRELADACRAEGLRLGVYLSPWDRNHPAYGTAEYNRVFAAMLREVLTGYGAVSEVWFDGANGEGPNGKRQVYDWPLFVRTVRAAQPNAVIFSDAGPDVRWVGNEAGQGSETNWAMLRRMELEPGTPRYAELGQGHENGTHWVPAECDVSIRPGWFWRESERPKTPEQLLDIFYASVGRGGSLLLNVPPNRHGLIDPPDVEALRGWKRLLDRSFAAPIPTPWFSQAPPPWIERGPSWDDVAWSGAEPLEVAFDAPRPLAQVLLGEPIALGQRVRKFAVDARVEGEWRQVAEGTTIGAHRIVRFPPVVADRLRVRVTASRATPALRLVQAYGPGP